MRIVNFADAAGLISEGRVGILPTDTVYGIAASALDPKAVERLFELKGRDSDKPPVIVIDSYDDMEKLGAKPEENLIKELNSLWPAKVSVIVPVAGHDHLHRGKGSLAFRMPDMEALAALARIAGPVATSSANIQGETPATNLEEAKSIFGDRVDFYVDGGDLDSTPSTMVRWDGSKFELVRAGAVVIDGLQP